MSKIGDFTKEQYVKCCKELVCIVQNGLKNDKYLLPIKIRAPLIFAHLACTKIKGSKFAQYKCAKIKGRRKIQLMNEKTANLQ